MEKVCAIVLAAGDGKRMRSSRPKVLCEVLFRPMICWIAGVLEECGVRDVCAVLGTGADQVHAAVPRFSWVEQKERLGTGHAVMQAKAFLQEHRGGDCAVLYGDTPLMDADTLQKAYLLHKKEGAAVTLVTASLPDPAGYGRIVRNEKGDVSGIVEQADADEKTLQIREINAGTYWFSVDFLLDALDRLRADNAQGEYYLTDVIGIAAALGRRVCGYQAVDSRVAMGANDRKGLLRLNEIARQAELERHMDSGVEIVCADGVVIGQDTTILPGTILKGRTVIGKNCVIGPNTAIEDSTVGDGCRINACQIEQSRLEGNIKIGPFTHVRPNSHLKAGVKIGNFVEVKNSVIDENTAVAHLTYVGDSDVGKNVNFGCGTVTVNFDGHAKYRTVIGDDCFIGCNSNLIAPVEIGAGSYIAAGSTITDPVPDDALAIARARQVVKPGWARARRLRLGPRKK